VSAGRNEFDPYRDRIQAGLLTGDAAAVRQTIKDYRSTFPAAQWPDKLKALKTSVAESNPLRPGGSVKQSAQSAFLSWARKSLPAGEVTRISQTSQYLRPDRRVGRISDKGAAVKPYNVIAGLKSESASKVRDFLSVFSTDALTNPRSRKRPSHPDGL
jgi:hypothetical protein